MNHDMHKRNDPQTAFSTYFIPSLNTGVQVPHKRSANKVLLNPGAPFSPAASAVNV